MLINKYIICIQIFVLLYQACGQLSKNIKHCPPMCFCDSIERYVLCQDNKLYQVPLPLPNGTKLLGLSKNEFTSLSANTFNGMTVNTTVESLVLYDNKIAVIRPNSFKNTRKLKNLWLFGNRLKQLKEKTFAGLKELEDLDISRNELTYIENNTFKGLIKLQVLQLWGNSLETLQINSFAGLENLCNLTLGDNKFKRIPTQALKHLTNLKSLELLNLPIEKIPGNAFEGLRKLDRLHIGDWPLLGQHIDQSSFSGLSALTYLSLYGCDLGKIPSIALSPLKSLKQLLLNNNPRIKRITEKDFSTLHNLEELHLSNIGLHIIHESPFKMLTKLRVLDLSQNNISTLPSHLFFQLEHLKMLNLSHNQLEVLSSSAFVSLNRINTIDLLHNNLICDCDIKWLKSLQELKIREDFTLRGECTDPLKYKGYKIVSLPPRKFVCEPPSFDDYTIKIKGTVGSPIWLPCSPQHGVPTPKIQWEKANSHMPTNSKILINGSLFLKQLKKEDNGLYVCEATNKFGNANATVYLTVVQKEDKKHNHSASHLSTGIAVSFAFVFLAIVGICFYRRNYEKLSRLYSSLDSSEETQRHPLKSGFKLS